VFSFIYVGNQVSEERSTHIISPNTNYYPTPNHDQTNNERDERQDHAEAEGRW
jgi:hypothetical protein